MDSGNFEKGKVIALGRRIALTVVTVFIFLTVLSGQAQAFQVINEENVYIPPSKTLEGPYCLVRQNVRVDGNVDGDLVVMASSLLVNGKVQGDLIVLCGEARVNGPIQGDIRLAATDASIRNQVQGSVTGLCDTLYLEEGGIVGRDLQFAANNFSLYGQVNRHLSAAGKNIYIDGNINGNMRLARVSSLKLSEKAHIKGDLAYSSPEQASVASGAVVEGQQKWQPLAPEKTTAFSQYMAVIMSFLGLLLVWLVIKALFPAVWDGLVGEVVSAPWKTLVRGVLAFFGLPILGLVFFLSVLGIPLALMLGVSYLFLIYLSRIIVGCVLGNIAGQVLGWQDSFHPFWLALLGLSMVILLTHLPHVGGLFSVFVIWWGIGAAVSLLMARRRPERLEAA